MARESQGKLRTEREQPIEKVKDLVERTVNCKREQRKQEGKLNTKYPGELENEGKPGETMGKRQRGNQGNYRNRMRENRETHDVFLIKLWERVRDLQCKSWGMVGFFLFIIILYICNFSYKLCV
jgi:hypothetical protein